MQDVSGKDKSRPLWSRYFSDTLALIWVVDSTDDERLQLCKQELRRLMREPELSKAIILVYLNKQDLRNGEMFTQVCVGVCVCVCAYACVCSYNVQALFVIVYKDTD